MQSAAAGALWLSLAAAAGAMIDLHAVLGVGRANLVWVGLAAGAVLGGLRRTRWARGVAAVMLGSVLLVSVAPGIPALVHGRVRTDSLPSRRADAVVVLAGSVSTDGRIGVGATDRLLEGIRLVKAGAAPRLVVSQVSITRGDDTVTSDADVRYLLTTAGLEAEVHTLRPVGTTRIEAERFRELAAARGWRAAVVVTSPLHTRRACRAFERVGVTVTCRASPDRSLPWQSLTGPDARLAGFGAWLYEALAWLEYRIRGWV